MTKKYLLFCFSFFSLLLILLSACSNQDEDKTTPPTTAPMSQAETAESTTATQQAPNPPMEEQQKTDISNEETGTDKSSTATKIEEQQETANQSTGNTEASHQEQLALARKSGCLACHAIDKKVVGPPWRDVSKRYLNDPNAKAKLVAKVSQGGRGNWTEVVGSAAMPAYSPRVSNENITKLVEFVLSLEKK